MFFCLKKNKYGKKKGEIVLKKIFKRNNIFCLKNKYGKKKGEIVLKKIFKRNNIFV